MIEEIKYGAAIKHTALYLYKLDETGSGVYFTTSLTKTDTPTATLTRGSPGHDMKKGLIKRVHYRLNPTNAATYTLRLWEAPIDNNYESNMRMLWESPTGQLDNVEYDPPELNIPFTLVTENNMYYSIEWTAAAGTTPGFLEVSGEVFE